MSLIGKGRSIRSNWGVDISKLRAPIIPGGTAVLSNALKSFILDRNKTTTLKVWNGTRWEYPQFLRKLVFISDLDDEDYSGVTFRADVESGVNFGDILYLDGSVYKKASASSLSKAPAKVIAIEGEGINKLVLRTGFVRFSSRFSFTAGSRLWLSTSLNGLLSAAQPSVGNAIQELGWAYNSSTVFFDPNQTFSTGTPTDAELSYLSGVTSAIQSQLNAKTDKVDAVSVAFETVSKNLKTYPYTLNYISGSLSSIVYDTGLHTITKTFNYTGSLLTSIVLSGDGVPSGIPTTKTLAYSGNTLLSISYS